MNDVHRHPAKFTSHQNQMIPARAMLNTLFICFITFSSHSSPAITSGHNNICEHVFNSLTVYNVPKNDKELYEGLKLFKDQVLVSYREFVQVYFEYKKKEEIPDLFFQPFLSEKINENSNFNTESITELNFGELKNISASFFKDPRVTNNLYFQLFEIYKNESIAIANANGRNNRNQFNHYTHADNDILQRIPSFYLQTVYKNQNARQSIEMVPTSLKNTFYDLMDPIYGLALAEGKLSFIEIAQNNGYFTKKDLHPLEEKVNSWKQRIDKILVEYHLK